MTAPRRTQIAVPIYLGLLAGMSVYICRELFHREHTAHMHAMHGFWMAIARLADTHWFWPQWWPYWDVGMPFEFTYAPLVPGLIAAYAKLAGCSTAMAYHAIVGFIYCLGPLTLFLMAWKLSGAPGYSFAASIAYSLTAPTQLIVPDGRFSLAEFLGARRLYLSVVWDETPHQAALAFLPLAILFLALSLEKRRPLYYVLAGLFMALTLLASAFGGTMLAMAILCLLFVQERRNLLGNLGLTVSIGLVAYLVVSPFLPPSLIATIRRNANLYQDSGWSLGSLTALSAVILSWTILWSMLRRWTEDRFLRFAALFAVLTSSLPLLETYGGRHALPQPNRYKVEMEMALALVAVFAVRPLLEKFPRSVKAALCLFLLSLAGEQVVNFRRQAKDAMWPKDVTQTIEYRAARWVEQNLPGRRVFLPGSVGQWSNAFTGVTQFAGGSYPTAYNKTQQVALSAIYSGQDAGERDAAISLLWLKAFGVHAVGVPAPKSPERWKPYAKPRKFEGLLPVLWRDQDTTVYGVPQRSASLARVVPAQALVAREPSHGLDVVEVERYVAALDDPAAPAAEIEWQGSGKAVIRARLRRGDVLSVQVNHHPGWRARLGDSTLDVHRDGLGLIWLAPEREGECEIELSYQGGLELRACRILSYLTLLSVAGVAIWRSRRRRAG